ncbi:MAG: UDP-3-O-(3-hydroxymyristoyl)glucosamine N-acyltransferase [Clostridiales bacterium]|nr:MAG: UDP-3-O-(3-hydroxymyristoyl)glucosamine N-acyltransferase [Clostridiales bacterium]
MRLSYISNNLFNLDYSFDTNIDILGMATSNYREEDVLSFLSDVKFLEDVNNNENVKALIVDKNKFTKKIRSDISIIHSENPKQDFFHLHRILAENHLYWENFETEIDSTARISKFTNIPKKNVRIGKNTIIEENVKIYPGCIIGENVILRSGSVIGAQGFQFIKTGEDVISVYGAGRVVIGDNVEVMNNSTIDRGIFGGDTHIEEYVKIDKLCYIAHDCKIGKRTFIISGSTIGGRVEIGKDCRLGFNSTILNGIIIGDRVNVSLGSVVTKNIESDTKVSGNFAIEHKKFIENLKLIR